MRGLGAPSPEEDLARALRRAEAELVQREVIRRRIAYNGPEHPWALASMATLADILPTERDSLEKAALYRQVVKGMENNKSGLGNRDFERVYRDFAEVLYKMGDFVAAEPVARRLFAWDEKQRQAGERTPQSAKLLADVLKGLGDYAGAEPIYRKVFESEKSRIGNDWMQVAEIASGYSFVCEKLGRHASADAPAGRLWKSRATSRPLTRPSSRPSGSMRKICGAWS